MANARLFLNNKGVKTMKRPSVMWSVSLLVISLTTIVLVFFGAELPGVLKILLGVIELAALPVLIYTTVKFMKSDK